ncbi:MAG TPA: hypothetical protein VJP04_14115 [Terriglobales bacterium]|nr:hypothetical protein [Terriglobales bacterium]
MEHIAETAWADFVRGHSTPETKSAIESHLATGCAACSSAATLWKSFLGVAAKEQEYTPPPQAIRLVEAQFAAAKVTAPSTPCLTSLVFDSFARPLPAGIRSGAPVARQMVYEAEGVTIDLRIDKHANSKALSIVGQVLDARTLRLASEAVPVALLNRQGEALQSTWTTNFGEFHLEVAAEAEMQLAIEVDAERSIRIPLPSSSYDRAGDFGEQNRLRGRSRDDYTGK